MRVPRPASGQSKGCVTWFGDDLPIPVDPGAKTRFVYSSYGLHPDTYCKETMLFNLDTDPYEDNDVSADEPDRLQALAELLQDHLDAAGEKIDIAKTVS